MGTQVPRSHPHDAPLQGRTLPRGVTSKMLSDWGSGQGWAIKPIKQLGN